uniref:Transmembrane protein 208 n=1 Tax=Corethrella appendiculata TaxID=1370023 RepID=U5EXR3_9DIPT
MAPPQKGKQLTKGAKQIVEENEGTLKFYRNLALGSSIIYFFVTFLFMEPFAGLTITMTIISVATQIGSFQFMTMMSRPQISESGSILDSGTDLNMEGGISEHVKDILIVASGTQLLALISNYFWFLLLAIPIRAIWLLWGSVIKPWLTANNGEQEQQVDEKKQKKLERKMKRMR